jgi:serine/threonine-protein kinase
MSERDDDNPTAPGRGPVMPGLQRIGEHDVTGVLGRGGFGVVYAAERDGKPCAIKVLAAELAGDEEMIKRFAREARVVNLIDHPCIVQTTEVGRMPDGRPYFVMERIDGQGLDQVIRSRGSIAPADIVAILTPVCEALAAAHAAGVVHRDLKAANILVAVADDRWTVRLADFGIAKVLDRTGASSLTIAGQRLGTPECMAPEQIAGGEIDARADVYALGILVYHMVAGHYPFRHGDPREVERLQLTAPPPPLAMPALDAVIQRALDKRPGARYPDALALLVAVRAAFDRDAPRSNDDRDGEGDDDDDDDDDDTLETAGRRRAAPPQEAPPTVRVVDGGPGTAVIVVVDEPRSTGEALDAAALTAAADGGTVQLRTFPDGTAVCTVRGGGAPASLARAAAGVALAVRERAPRAAIAVRLAVEGHVDLHTAFNAAIDRAVAPGDDGAIAFDGQLARWIERSHRIERRDGADFLLPRRGPG